MLELKLARPVILMHANFCATNTNILADGVLMYSNTFKQNSGSAAHG
jgi:hypothetical protein